MRVIKYHINNDLLIITNNAHNVCKIVPITGPIYSLVFNELVNEIMGLRSIEANIYLLALFERG